MDKQKLIEKVARFAGWKEGTCGWWYDPKEPLKPLSPFILTQSLDACRKWLIPKLNSYCIRSFTSNLREMEHGAEVWQRNNQGEALAETPALALCLAIEKLISGGD